MVRRDGAFVKTERIKTITRQIARSFPGEIDIEKMIIWIEVNIGLSPGRAREYIEKACIVQDWNILEGQIVVKNE